MKTIVCYGDSNTWGFDPVSFGRYPKNVRWAGKLGELLGKEYDVCEEGLNGRTTAFEDPLEPHRNGAAYIETCMLTNAPIDLLIIVLGTNDVKPHLGQHPFSISKGIERLIKLAQKEEYGVNGKYPELLIVSPVSVDENVGNTWLAGHIDQEGVKKSRELPKYYKAMADTYGCHFLDLALVAKASDADCVHLDPDAHESVAKAIAQKVKEILK